MEEPFAGLIGGGRSIGIPSGSFSTAIESRGDREPSIAFFVAKITLSKRFVLQIISERFDNSLVGRTIKHPADKVTQQGNKIENGTRRSYLSIKVKKHLSALGWVFSYAFNGKKREMRYKSTDGKWFHSLDDACLSGVDEDIPRRRRQQQQIKMKRVKDCYNTTAFHKEKTCSFKIVLNIDVSNQQQKKRRNTTMAGFDSSAPDEDKSEIRARRGKSLNKVLQVMEKKNKKCEKRLLLCDGCPSAFHYTCLRLSSLPKEKLWFCSCCCCDVCGSIETSGNSKLMTCEQCQRRFHLKCLKQDPCLVSYKGWFCSRQCSRVFSVLQSLVGRKIAVSNRGIWFGH
ncbi:hypothetical protein HID58_018830 [Brassica napus]|uniref:Zinc finger PHD-type domain-containing protein n=1 Tax=Brassica napus TaxID=3708 RepID=A0ABQ8DB37_BRANA|nr:hypothetical protein HID58_018830 [Brassica napus]